MNTRNKPSRKRRTHAKNGIPSPIKPQVFLFPDSPFLNRHIVFSKQKWRNSVQDTTKPRGFVEAQEGKYFRVSSPNCTWEWLGKKTGNAAIPNLSLFSRILKNTKVLALSKLSKIEQITAIEPFPNCYKLVVLIQQKHDASWISTSPHLTRESLLHHPRRGVHGVPKEAKTR